MAIFSLKHHWIGKSHKDWKPGKASEHANYITRESALSEIMGARLPLDRLHLKDWLDRQEAGDRKNARVIDKVMVALPIEMTPAQRRALVWEFCERITEGRASWAAAVHAEPEDGHNPHAHIILRDRDFETGRRVMETTEKGSTVWLREQWEFVTNRALERAGIEARIDRRTLKEQGIEREPGVHLGPKKKEREEREREKSRSRSSSGDRGPDWTSRAGMAAQQKSALNWVKAAGEKRQGRQERASQQNDERRKEAARGGQTETREQTDRLQREASKEREATDEIRRRSGVDAMIAKRKFDRERESEGGREQ